MRRLQRGSSCLSTFRTLSSSVPVLLLAASSALASAPTLHPNTAKYSDRSAAATSARAGDAELHARALLGRTATDVEVSTAPFDGGVAAGLVEKVQIKVLANGRTETTNHAASGASAGVALPLLPRGTGVQVQANVRSGQRTGVITLEDTVKLRPDLAVTQLDLPSTQPVGSRVVVSAVVAELNRDWGARANCVLRVDGVEADRASGIWVDAGGVVSCTFTHQFNAPGSHQVDVALEGTDPGDYDTANDRATGQIRIVASAPDFSLYARASTFTARVVSTEDDAAGHRVKESTSDREGALASWRLQGKLPFLLGAVSSAAFHATTDGAPYSEFSASSFYENSRTVDYGGGRLIEIHSSFAGDEYADFILISREREVGASDWTTHIVLQNLTGEVAYLSSGFLATFVDGVEVARYVWNQNETRLYGGGHRPLGDSLQMSFTVDAGGLHLTAAAEIPQLEPLTVDTAWTSCFEFFGTVYCTDFAQSERGVQGWATGDFVY